MLNSYFVTLLKGKVTMKYLKMFLVVIVMMAFIGCENAELIDCQQENDSLMAANNNLQQQVERGKQALVKQKKDSEAMQTRAMQGITTMLTKQEQIANKFKAQTATAKKEANALRKQLGNAQAAAKTQADAVKAQANAAKEQAAAENAKLTAQVAKLQEALEAAKKAEPPAVEPVVAE